MSRCQDLAVSRSRRFVPQARDFDLLTTIHDYRAMLRDQIIDYGFFGSISRANARLGRLRRQGLLDARPVGYPRGAQLVYLVAPAATELLAPILDQEPKQLREEIRHGVSPTSLEHTLRIVDFYLALKRSDSEASLPIRLWQPERGCRHAYTIRQASTGRKQRFVLKPDALAVFELDRIKSVNFVELDLGHTSAPKFAQKIASYERYGQGVFQRTYGCQTFQVLIVTTSAKRLSNLQRLAKVGTPRRYWLSTFDEIDSIGPFGPVWRVDPDSPDERTTLRSVIESEARRNDEAM